MVDGQRRPRAPALARARAREAIAVLLGLIPGGRFDEKARELGFTPLPDLSLETRRDLLGPVRDAVRLRRLVRAEGVDVVHAHHSHDHWLGWICRGRAALVRSFHSARSVRADWPARALYRRTDALVAVSAEIAARLRAAGADPARTSSVGGVTDVARFAEAGGGETIRKELGLGEAPVVGTVARLAAGRGHEPLIDGFSLLLSRRPDARLLLVGKGERRAHLERYVAERALGEQVRFAGYRDADLPAVLDALDVFALMGAGSDESCRAVLEAMAAGRPVVGRRVGAIGEAVVHGDTGLLLEDDRPDSVAAALESLIGQPERALAMGQSGRRRALSSFTPEGHAAAVEVVYRRALLARSAAPP